MTTLEQAIQRVVDCARSTLLEQRREFARGEVDDLDELEDALNAYDRCRGKVDNM